VLSSTGDGWHAERIHHTEPSRIAASGQIDIVKEENTMKSSTKDQAEGTFHELKGKVKEVAGKLSDDPKLEAEGTDENIAGKVQQKIGQVKKVFGK
jgi:uncharacterized protein YjbJ (UPF0337 family)